ncbi:unnamed protein product [Effrenium voratum]|uniref:Uncharacterized protein n=1 Tax=Effrenium voratum TaxID=2562239 RepID=A0AA36NDQ3_9DINO|nr:unnamed protein product [Effrenium voratum]
MSQGPAAELLRACAKAPQRRELWRRQLAALPPPAPDASVQELAAADALRRYLHRESRTAVPAPLLAELERGGAVRLAHFAKAYAALRVRDPPVLQALQRRSAELQLSWNIQGRSLAELLDSLGKLAGHGEAGGSRREPQGREEREAWIDLGWRGLSQHVRTHFLQSASQMRLIDLAVGLGGLARLEASPEVLTGVQHVVITALGQDEPLDPRHVATLVASYSAFARLGFRDDAVLDAAGAALERCCREGRDLPVGYLLPFIKSLATHLRPAPKKLAQVLEVAIPRVSEQLTLQQLEGIVECLAFVPHLRGSRNSLGQRLFDACLAAPLSAIKTPALIGAMRSAWSLGYREPGFWAPALEDARRRADAELAALAAGSGWAVGDVAYAALLAARVMRKPKEKEPKPAHLDTSPDAAAAPARGLLGVICQLALRRMPGFQPREMGILATALVSSDQEDGHLFAALSFRALDLLHRKEAFNSLDLCQLLLALAHFGYRDELLLKALAGRLEGSWDHCDEKARDIAMWSFSQLGGVPGKDAHPRLAEALVEYELSQGKATDRTEEHMTAAEIAPLEDPPPT